ncbi:MAG: HAMP domain-containing protein, partial [Pyrinomonadaceae bacterium]|nr:HAMP domain-containing protein [Pyrinomonadaceae bacterium]
MSLHLKTALLASIVILFVMTATLFLFGASVRNHVRAEQKQIAQLEAETLAEQISGLPAPRDYQQIAKAVELVRRARQQDDDDEVRIWERSGGVFVKRIAGKQSAANEELSDEIKSALRSNEQVKFEESDADIYRVYVPITEGFRVSGAVEFIEKLDTTYTLINRYLINEIWVFVVALFVLTFSIYALFRHFVRRPLDKIISAMRRAKNGELDARVDLKTTDEIGELASEFNRTLSQIEEMTKEREAQKDVLQTKVFEATSELQLKNQQLENASRELWQTSRRLTQSERLAAAGQTAAQFAHEVGTPLNLISGHVQLLKLNINGNESAQNRLETITTQIERIEKIVRGMLDRTKFGETEFENLDVNGILRGIIAVTAPTLQSKNVRLIESLQPEMPCVKANSDLLQQVFINLINNALDAMPDSGVLKISTSTSEENVCVEIADDGAGMDDATKARIFEPLFTTK